MANDYHSKTGMSTWPTITTVKLECRRGQNWKLGVININNTAVKSEAVLGYVYYSESYEALHGHAYCNETGSSACPMVSLL